MLRLILKQLKDMKDGFLIMIGLKSMPENQLMIGSPDFYYPTIKECTEIVEKRNLRVHYYLPLSRLESNEDPQFIRALSFLQSTGHIITNMDGSLFGSVATLNLSSEEKAKFRRKQLKIISKVTSDI